MGRVVFMSKSRRCSVSGHGVYWNDPERAQPGRLGIWHLLPSWACVPACVQPQLYAMDSRSVSENRKVLLQVEAVYKSICLELALIVAIAAANRMFHVGSAMILI
jgi:hypothetical protein